MNLIGWLIIMWRDLFVEGDYIEVGKYSGYVKHIGPLYFTIEEASDLLWGDKTGKEIKIPNSLIANNPIVNFSVENNQVEGKVVFTFSFKSSMEKINKLIQSLSADFDKLNSKPQFTLRVVQEKPLGIQLTIRYLSFKQDQKMIEDKVFATVMNAVSTQEDLDMSVAT
jgi:small-conductance mechanosensitive channel